jgi:hypothetical protein
MTDPRHLFVVHTKPVPGQVDGFVNAQRFVLGDHQTAEFQPEGQPHRYLALYEVAGDPQQALANLARAAAAGLQMTTAPHPDRRSGMFTSITPLLR